MMASLPSYSWLWTLIDAGMRSLLMAAAVAGGLRLLRVSHVMARKVAWTLVLCGAIMMPALAPWMQSQPWLPIRAAVPVGAWLERLPAWKATAAPDPAAPVRHIFPARTEALPDARPVVTDRRAPDPTLIGDRFPAPAISIDRQGTANENENRFERARGAASWSETALLVYATVALFFLIRIAIGCIATARLWSRALPVLEIAADNDGMIRWSRDVSSPVTVGSGILLPEDHLSWDVEKLRIVIAHESSHVRQGDFYLQLCAAIYAAVFWFSPLGWWLKRTLCDLSEAISDRAAVREASTHASYARILLEFAALPRTARIGVAMARAGRLSDRIERLLDESSFRRAFAGGRGRIAAAALLAPLALFAATSLIRVQAAGQEKPAPAAPTAPPAPSIPTSPSAAGPAAPALPAPPSLPASADIVPATPAEPQQPGAPDSTDVAPRPPSGPGEVPPAPGVRIVGDVGPGRNHSYSFTTSQSDSASNSQSSGSASTWHSVRSYAYSDDGEAYALIRGNDKNHMTYSGDWVKGRREEIDKARQMAHGDFLWFTRDGKSYVVEDPAIVSALFALYKPMEDLGRQQEELGRQQEELGKEQEKLGERMRETTVPAPDLSGEMARLRAAMAELEASRGKSVTQDQLAELQSKLAEIQGRLGSLQGEVGARQGEFGAQQGELGAKQGRLGEQQGRLGAEQGRIAEEADRKVKSIIDESLKNGKARPVE